MSRGCPFVSPIGDEGTGQTANILVIQYRDKGMSQDCPFLSPIGDEGMGQTANILVI